MVEKMHSRVVAVGAQGVVNAASTLPAEPSDVVLHATMANRVGTKAHTCMRGNRMQVLE